MMLKICKLWADIYIQNKYGKINYKISRELELQGKTRNRKCKCCKPNKKYEINKYSLNCTVPTIILWENCQHLQK